MRLTVEEDFFDYSCTITSNSSCVYNFSAVENRVKIQAKVFDFLKKKHTTVTQGDVQLQCVNNLAALASRKEDYEFLAKVLNGCDCIPGLVLDTDLRWQLVIALAEGGYADEAN